MKKVIASLALASTLLASMPVTPVRAAEPIRLLRGAEVGGYNGTSFHLVTKIIDGYTFEEQGSDIVLHSTGGSGSADPAILYSFPVASPQRGDVVSWTAPNTGRPMSFPYPVKFKFVQWLLGTAQDAQGNLYNPRIDVSSVAVGSVSDEQDWGGSGPVHTVLNTQLFAYPQSETARLYLPPQADKWNLVDKAAENKKNNMTPAFTKFLESLNHGASTTIDGETQPGTTIEGTLFVNVRLLPPGDSSEPWKITRWSYTYDPLLPFDCAKNPGLDHCKVAENKAPVAVNDALDLEFKTSLGGAFMFSEAFLMSNDTDEDSPKNALKITQRAATTSAGNTLVWDDSGIVSFKPQPGWDGDIDTFTYRIKDEQTESNDATVIIKINGKPQRLDVPKAVPDTVPVPKGTASPVTIPVLANDQVPTEPADKTRTIAITKITTPLSGSAQIVGDKVTYTPNPAFIGDDVIFTYTIAAYVDGVKTDKESTAAITVKYECGLNPNAPQCAAVQRPPAPSCKPGGVLGDSAEDLTRTIPTGDGRYQFITRSDRGSTGNYKVFVASETLETDRQAFRDYNNVLSDYLGKSSASSKDYKQPTIKTDFLATLTAAGMGTVGDKEIALLMQQVEDINRFIKAASPDELHQLNTIQGRTKFWTAKGIYDKYTPKEIAFMNSVAFPVAMATEVNGLLVGAALGEGSAQLSIPSSAKTLSVVTVLENQEALADVWRKVASGQPFDVQELATRLTSKEDIQKAVNTLGLGTDLSDTLHKAIKAASGTSDTASALQLLADKLDKTPEVNKGQVKNYLHTMSKAWGVPEVVGEVNAEQYKQVMQIINQMSCVSGAPTSVWNIDHKLSN